MLLAVLLVQITLHAQQIGPYNPVSAIDFGRKLDSEIPPEDSQAKKIAQSSPILVSISVNGTALGDVTFVVRDPEGRFFALPATFAAARITLPKTSGVKAGSDVFYPLDAVPGLRYQFDDATQSLNITLPAGQFDVTRIDAKFRHGGQPSSVSPGFTINHDIVVSSGQGHVGTSGLFEALAFHSAGYLSNSVIASDVEHDHSIRRLQSQFVHESPDKMTTLTVGDGMTSGGDWTHQLNFAGVRWGTSFNVQPSFIPYAMPGLEGQAATPSTLDLYVNSVRTLSEPVNTGPFTIQNIPVVTSQGNVQMVLTDAMGHQQIVTTAYLFTPLLLRQGVQNFNYQAGILRWGIGTAGDTYHTMFVSASHQYGLSDHFTIGVEGEGAGISQAVGVNGAWGLLPVGVLSAGTAVGHSVDGTGGLVHAEFSHSQPKFGFGAGAQYATKPFREIGLNPLQGNQRLQAQAQASYSFTSGVGAGLGYTLRQNYWSPTSLTMNYRGATASLSVRLGRVGSISGSVNYSPNVPGRVASFLILSIPVGPRRLLSASSGYSGQKAFGSAMYSQPLPTGDGTGYRAMYSSDNSAEAVGMDYQNRWGTYSLDLGNDASGRSYRGEEKSAFVWIQDKFMATRWIHDSFALIEVPDTKGVRVYANNQFVAKTDGRGLAAVPLVAYDTNQLRLDEQGMPLDLDLDLHEHTVVPKTHTGLLLRLQAKVNHSVTVILQQPDGKPVPVGTEAHVKGKDATLTVGYDGEAYLENVDLPTVLVVGADETECSAEVPASSSGQPFQKIGPVICKSK